MADQGVITVQLDVVADDRTGALETAAALADRLGSPIPVVVWPDAAPARAVASVVDLASRHLTVSGAGARAAAVPVGRHSAHKVDSTLRGNWAAELTARHRATGARVLVVPALPELGRTCERGIVLVDGVPVHETAAGTDARGGVPTSRPSDLLTAASGGRIGVVELRDAAEVSRWLDRGTGIAVADADADTIEGIVERWREVDGVLLAGTSAVIGACVGRRPPHDRPPTTAGLAPPVLVVCGSVNPRARAQIEDSVARGALATGRLDTRAVERLRQGAPVILSSPWVTGTVTPHAAAVAASRLVAEASTVIESGIVGTLVVIGGDTAAALLGDALVVVHGSLHPGTALVESLVVDVPIVTRAGGFGADDALSGLLWGTLA